MPPFVYTLLGSFFRWLFGLLGGYLVTRGIWTEAQAAEVVGSLVLALVPLAWSVWQKISAKAETTLQVETAIQMPRKSTVADVEAAVTALKASGDQL